MSPFDDTLRVLREAWLKACDDACKAWEDAEGADRHADYLYDLFVDSQRELLHELIREFGPFTATSVDGKVCCFAGPGGFAFSSGANGLWGVWPDYQVDESLQLARNVSEAEAWRLVCEVNDDTPA